MVIMDDFWLNLHQQYGGRRKQTMLRGEFTSHYKYLRLGNPEEQLEHK